MCDLIGVTDVKGNKYSDDFSTYRTISLIINDYVFNQYHFS